jgi:hypothetical protein
MLCPVCVEEGKKSILYGGDSGMSTCMAFSSYHDEDGKYHHHNPNSMSYTYNCSNGHEFVKWGSSKCGSCNFGSDEGMRITKR